MPPEVDNADDLLSECPFGDGSCGGPSARNAWQLQQTALLETLVEQVSELSQAESDETDALAAQIVTLRKEAGAWKKWLGGFAAGNLIPLLVLMFWLGGWKTDVETNIQGAADAAKKNATTIAAIIEWEHKHDSAGRCVPAKAWQNSADRRIEALQADVQEHKRERLRFDQRLDLRCDKLNEEIRDLIRAAKRDKEGGQ